MLMGDMQEGPGSKCPLQCDSQLSNIEIYFSKPVAQLLLHTHLE